MAASKAMARADESDDLQAVARRAKTQVTRITSTARYKALPPDRKISELNRLEVRIMRTVPAWVFSE